MMNIDVGIVTQGVEQNQETFINAHRELLPFNIHFYYGRLLNLHCNGKKLLPSYWKKIILRLYGRLFLKKDFFEVDFQFKTSVRRKKIKCLIFEFGTVAVDYYKYALEMNIPFIVNFYGYDINTYSILAQNKKDYQNIFKESAYITTVSHEMKTKLITLGCIETKIVVNQAGPHKKFQSLKPLFTSQNFFALGRFVDKKSPIETILAFHILLKEFPDARLNFGGDGPLLEATRRLVSGLNIQSNVNFIGRLGREDYLIYMENAIAFLQHSVTANSGDMEGTPVAILEAGLSGIPVISTKHAGIPEVVVHNKTGLLVEEHDIKTMAKYMSSLIGNKSLAKKLGGNAKNHIIENFSMELHTQKLSSLISEVCDIK